jgi:hypothetical protein
MRFMNRAFSLLTLLSASVLIFTGCDFIGGVFKTGVGVGVFIAVVVIILIVALIARGGRRRM